MTLSEVKMMLKELGIDVKYRYSKKVLSPPYIPYYRVGSNAYYADGVTYFASSPIIIELYADDIDILLEERLESLLKEKGLAWEKDEDWIASENMYQITYESEV